MKEIYWFIKGDEFHIYNDPDRKEQHWKEMTKDVTLIDCEKIDHGLNVIPLPCIVPSDMYIAAVKLMKHTNMIAKHVVIHFNSLLS